MNRIEDEPMSPEIVTTASGERGEWWEDAWRESADSVLGYCELVRGLERVYCWANRCADLDKHKQKAKPDQLSTVWAAGYTQAVRDVMDKLEPLTLDWLETWQGEEWGFHREEDHGVEGF